MPTWSPANATLRNVHLTLRLEEKHGGRIVSMKASGVERTVPPSAVALDAPGAGERFGLLGLQLWQESYWHNDLGHSDWVKTGEANGTVAEVTYAGASAIWPGVTVSRTYRLAEDPWVEVEDVLDPGAAPTQPYAPPQFWYSSVMPARGVTFAPGPSGVLDLPRFAQRESWCHEPVDGWIGWVAPGRAGNGLAFLTEPEHLRHVRAVHRAADRVEWIRRRVSAAHTATIRLIPFTGLHRVDGAGDAGVVAVQQARSGEVVLDLYPLASGRAKVTLRGTDATGATVTYGSATQVVRAGTPARFHVRSKGGVSFTRCTWWDGTVTLAGAATGFAVASGVAAGGRLRGRRPRLAPVTEVGRLDKYHRRPPSPYLFGATPAPLPDVALPVPPTRRLRVLALAPQADCASVLALARRFDLDVTVPFVPTSAPVPTTAAGIGGTAMRWELGDRFEALLGDELLAAWTAALAAGVDYDAILLVLGDQDPWSLLPKALQAEVLRRVKAGTGLVLVHRNPPAGPNTETTDLIAALPLVGGGGGSDYSGRWHPSADPVVAGLPWALMPGPGRVYGLSVRTGADTLAEFDYPTAPPTPMPVLARGTLGKGRVLHLAWGAQLIAIERITPAGAEGWDGFRHDLDLLGRLVFHAARADPAVGVADVALAASTATVTLTGGGAFALDWCARDRFGVPLASGHQDFAAMPPQKTVSVPVPRGAWTCEVVTTPAKKGDTGFGAGGRVAGVDLTVSVTQTTAGTSLGPHRGGTVSVTPNAPAGTTLVVEVLDGRGRICERSTTIPGQAVRIWLDRVTTPAGQVRVHALDAAGALVAQGWAPLALRRRTPWGGWQVHFWNAVRRLPTALQTRRLDANAHLGTTSYMLVPRADPAVMDAADLLGIPYVVESSGWLWVHGGQAPDGTGTPISLTDTATTATGQATDTALAAALLTRNVLYFRAGDDEPDNPLGNVCFAPRTVALFRAWLGAAYGSDAALDAAWRSSATLATATPADHAATVASFPGSSSYAPWVDHRRFMTALFSSAPEGAGTALRLGYPSARAGTSGDNQMGMASARDWWVRGRALDVVGGYHLSTAAIVKEVGTLFLHWTLYDDPDPIARFRIATALGHGMEGLGVWKEETLVNPDLSLPEVGRDLAAATLPVRRGVGRLFSQATVSFDGVFVLMSPDSSAVCAIHGYESLGGWPGGTPPALAADLGTETRQWVPDLLSALGVGWRALDPAQMEAGALEREGAKLLILPMCAGLSDAACTAIRRFVAVGGHVLADLMPGVFTQSGVLRGTAITAAGALTGSAGGLDDVFGLTPGGRPPVVADTLTVAGVGIPVRCADTAVTAVTSAVPAGRLTGGGGAWFENRYKKGGATYVAASVFADYPAGKEKSSPLRGAVEAAMATTLARAGVAGRVTVTDPAGGRVASPKAWARRRGRSELVVVARDLGGTYEPSDAEADATLTFSSAAHTYDLEEGTYLGKGARLDVRLGSYTARLLSRVPYRVLAIRVTAPRAITLGDDLDVSVTLRTSGANPDPHLVRIDVLDAIGDPVEYLAREVETAAGSAAVVLASAFNDPPGPWTIQATDVLTGTTGRTQVACAPAASVAPLATVTRPSGIDD